MGERYGGIGRRNCRQPTETPNAPLHRDGYGRPASHLGDFNKFQRLARSNGGAPDPPLQADMCQTRAKILQHVQGLA